MKCKYVYIEIFDESNNGYREFHFHNVKLENDETCVTLYDENNVLEFRCEIDKISSFMREK